VSIVKNFQLVEETVEQYDPQHGVVRSEQKQEERQPKTERVGGIPGPRSTPTNNPAGAPAAQADQSAVSTNSDFVKQNETVNYEVSKAVRHVVNTVGKIERVSVAVVIDNHTKVTTDSD